MSNEANITIDEARALVADQMLWPRIRDFLWDFAPQIHTSWIENLGLPDSLGSLEHMEELRLAPRFKDYVLSSLGVEPCFHAFPKGDWSRLLLLDGAALESIVKWLGALECAEDLRKITDGKTVREMKAHLAGVYPEVFGFTAYFRGGGRDERDESDQRDIGERVVSAGVAILLKLFEPLPRPLASRLKFKLPKDLCALAPSGGESKDSRSFALRSGFLSKLLKLKFPEAYKLCC